MATLRDCGVLLTDGPARELLVTHLLTWPSKASSFKLLPRVLPHVQTFPPASAALTGLRSVPTGDVSASQCPSHASIFPSIYPLDDTRTCRGEAAGGLALQLFMDVMTSESIPVTPCYGPPTCSNVLTFLSAVAFFSPKSTNSQLSRTHKALEAFPRLYPPLGLCSIVIVAALAQLTVFATILI